MFRAFVKRLLLIIRKSYFFKLDKSSFTLLYFKKFFDKNEYFLYIFKVGMVFRMAVYLGYEIFFYQKLFCNIKFYLKNIFLEFINSNSYMFSPVFLNRLFYSYKSYLSFDFFVSFYETLRLCSKFKFSSVLDSYFDFISLLCYNRKSFSLVNPVLLNFIKDFPLKERAGNLKNVVFTDYSNFYYLFFNRKLLL